MASNWTPSLCQCSAAGTMRSDRSRTDGFGNPVWVDSTAVGRTVTSTPIEDKTGSAIVCEHRPRQEISCMDKILFMLKPSPR